MKGFLFFLLLLNSTFSQAMTKEWVVTKVQFDSVKKNYRIDFKNQAGVYRAEEELLPCLRQSLTEQKAVRINFNPLGLLIKSCEKVASK